MALNLSNDDWSLSAFSLLTTLISAMASAILFSDLKLSETPSVYELMARESDHQKESLFIRSRSAFCSSIDAPSPDRRSFILSFVFAKLTLASRVDCSMLSSMSFLNFFNGAISDSSFFISVEAESSSLTRRLLSLEAVLNSSASRLFSRESIYT